ncbi:unnamed protein product [Lampetra planeri]
MESVPYSECYALACGSGGYGTPQQQHHASQRSSASHSSPRFSRVAFTFVAVPQLENGCRRIFATAPCGARPPASGGSARSPTRAHAGSKSPRSLVSGLGCHLRVAPAARSAERAETTKTTAEAAAAAAAAGEETQQETQQQGEERQQGRRGSRGGEWHEERGRSGELGQAGK